MYRSFKKVARKVKSNSDSEIIDLLWSRSDDALSKLKEIYGSLCRHVAGNVLLNAEDVEECVNDTYLAVWNAIPPDRPQKLSSYICKITKNLALKKLRYNTALKRNPAMNVSMTEAEDFIFADTDLEKAALNKEVIIHINTFLKKLSFNERNIFLRKYFVGDSIAQISELFSFSESKVKTSLHRTKNKLSDYLVKKGLD